MIKKEKDISKDSEGLRKAIKRLLRGKSGCSCCNVIIEEVEEEKTGDKAESTEKK